MARRVVLGADDQTTALLGTAVDSFDDVYELLLVFDHPLDLVVVTRARSIIMCLFRQKNIIVQVS